MNGETLPKSVKVLEECAKKLIGYSRLALNNHKSNIDF